MARRVTHDGSDYSYRMVIEDREWGWCRVIALVEGLGTLGALDTPAVQLQATSGWSP